MLAVISYEDQLSGDWIWDAAMLGHLIDTKD